MDRASQRYCRTKAPFLSVIPLSHKLFVVQVVWAGIPGQEVGNSLADVLYGDWNPSGRLPYTIAKNASDYGAQLLLPAPGQNPSGTDPLQIPYTEGLNIDYRHFDAVSFCV